MDGEVRGRQQVFQFPLRDSTCGRTTTYSTSCYSAAESTICGLTSALNQLPELTQPGEARGVQQRCYCTAAPAAAAALVIRGCERGAKVLAVAGGSGWAGVGGAR